MKHVARRHYFVRDMVEAFELTVPYVNTNDNVADFLSKAIYEAKKFLAFRSIIMNEAGRRAADAVQAPAWAAAT